MKKIIFAVFCATMAFSECFSWPDVPSYMCTDLSYVLECSERGIKPNPYVCALKIIEEIHHHPEIKINTVLI